MESKKLIVTASPHITNHTSTRGLMLNVCIALLPALVASTLIFGARALLVTGVTVAACVGFEALYCVVMKKPVPVGDFSAVVTGMILAFNLPATIPLWIAIIGAFVAIVVAKQLFGGLGFNFANPALLGRIVLFIGFAGRMTAYAFPQTDIDALASATPLVAGNSMAGKDMLLQLLLGAHGGVLGETCAVALILGGFTGRIVYGVCLGVITCIIRFYGNMAEGVSFALLLMNLLVPYINDLTRQKPLGGAKAK